MWVVGGQSGCEDGWNSAAGGGRGRGGGIFPASSRAIRTETMKQGIHPDYHFVTVKLADGTEFQTRSTMEGDTYASEVDATNHPFYTGKRQFVDTTGRVEKFRRRYQKAAPATEEEAPAEEG